MVLPGLIGFFKIIGFIITSYLLVHVFALFGPFFAVAYPIWWLFTPTRTFCLFCRIKKEGEVCPLCRRIKIEAEGNYPKNFRSVILNSLLFLAFSLAAFGLVFTESKVLFKLGFPPTPKTVSFVIPSKGEFRLGEIFPMKIEIKGIQKPINAIQADISFDPNKVEVRDISTTDSFANIFIQKEINNQIGYARLTGGLPSPGFFADSGVFGSIFFQGKAPGLVKVEFLPSSLVLANDGRGTNVLKDLASASYLILPEKISPEEEELQKELITYSGVEEEGGQTQIRLYQEERVLGTQVGQEIEKGKKFNFFQFLFNILEKTDILILNFWTRIISF